MTNYEKIKNMTVEELARFLANRNQTDCINCPCFGEVCNENSCDNALKIWLESEVKE